MTDYDGADILISYLNGLTWTSLTKPSFYEGYERQSTVASNSIIVTQTGIGPEQNTKGTVRLTHTCIARFISDTKANAFANLWYVIQNIFNYSSDVSIKMTIADINVDYNNKRKNFNLIVNITELKNL